MRNVASCDVSMPFETLKIILLEKSAAAADAAVALLFYSERDMRPMEKPRRCAPPNAASEQRQYLLKVANGRRGKFARADYVQYCTSQSICILHMYIQRAYVSTVQHCIHHSGAHQQILLVFEQQRNALPRRTSL